MKKVWCFNCFGVCIVLLQKDKIEEWNKTHPAKTYLFCLRDKFPDLDEDIVTTVLCPGHLYKGGPVNKNCKSKFKCTGCWNQEAE